MSTTTTYSEERRADRIADAEQRRIDQAAADERRAVRQAAADERAARLREQQAADKVRAKEAKARARAERRAARGAALTAGNVYRKGTLALVTASALGSLPAQVLHFVAISPMLLPLPLAIEGAAWVMAAGVAYADERGLPGWVRWLLRGLVVAAAGFAASINYNYGTQMPGLSVSDAQTAGIGLAAVTLLGPLLFEIRQWVATLSAKTGDAQDRARRRHDRKRRRQHRPIALVADRLVSAAPFGELSFEDAFVRAWEIETGTATPGMTPKLHRRAARSLADLADARYKGEPSPAAEPDAPEQPEAPKPPAPKTPRKRIVKAKTSKVRTPAELLTEAQEVTADWADDAVNAEAIRTALHCSAANSRVLRDLLLSERSEGDGLRAAA